MKEIAIEELKINPVTLISDGWMLIAAGNEERGYNAMTASWGHIGSIWGHGHGLPTAVIYIRPQRYTKEFIDREPYYTLSFFSSDYKKQLTYLGTHSGRSENKLAKAGMTPEFGGDYVYFAEASLVLICRKLYRAPLLESGFVDSAVIEANYPQKDFHDMYIGEIVRTLVRD